ncbi:MAG: hypothetical protein J3Q66DRAFT_325949 [Benniella sp.]|nr:MAG: hypothetical protein J3Q66DRAFT_325949 [Benniella sp.]
MSGWTTILDIPHLLDAICSELGSKDIKNCAVCCKEWYSIFGPYRFRSLQITRGSRAKARFLYRNSHLIRQLKLKVTNLNIFDSSRCTRLQELELVFGKKDASLYPDEEGEEEEVVGYEDDEDGEYLEYEYEEDDEEDDEDEEDEDEDEDEDGDESDGTMLDEEDPFATIGTYIKVDRFELANALIQRSQGLRTLIIGPSDKLFFLRSMPQQILDGVKGHSYLTKIKINVNIACSQLAKLINHIPLQLLELDVDVVVESIYRHGFCDTQGLLLQSQDPVFRLRRLILSDSMVCFWDRIFIPLLERCPDLEHIQMPFVSFTWDFNGLMRLLGTYFQRLSSLVLIFPCSICWDGKDSSVFLQESSKGFQRLDLSGRYCRHDKDSPGWHKTAVLETLITSTTASTIEVLIFSAAYDRSDRIMGILENCPRLREFRVYNSYRRFEGVNASDLLMSMNTPWPCRCTLETLKLKVKGVTSVLDPSSADQGIKQLFCELRSLPRLVNLDLSYS